MRDLTCGYIPLTDAAVLIVAAEGGFAAERGLNLTLRREASWATLRDHLVLGHVDIAHLLAPLAVSTALGLGPTPPCPLVAPFALNRNGNALTLAASLWEEMGGPDDPEASVEAVAQAFAPIARRRAAAGRPLRLAAVFPYSTHTYMLRAFLRAGGLDPDSEVELTVTPPPYMASALAAREIDGFCVGSPWNSVAVEEGSGRIAVLGVRLDLDAPEKVVAYAPDRLPRETQTRLMAALQAAAAWCADPAHRPALAEILAPHVGVTPAILMRTLTGHMLLGRDGPVAVAPDYFKLGGLAHRPDPAFASWVWERMREAGHAPDDAAREAEAARVFDPALFDAVSASA